MTTREPKRTRRHQLLLGSCAAAAILFTACAAPRPASAPMTPSSMPPTGPTPPPSAAPPSSLTGTREERERAWTELQDGEKVVMTALGDCALVCKALASMERAASRLCDMSTEPDDVKRCDEARGKLEEAKRRVRAHCTCSLDSR